MSEINNLRADVNARLSILKRTTDDLKSSLDAAWVEKEALKQQDEQNRLQLDNYTRRESIWHLNVPKSQDENCKEWRVRTKSNSMQFTMSENKEMTESLVQLLHGLSTTKPEMIFGIDKRSLPTLQIMDMSSCYPTMLTRL